MFEYIDQLVTGMANIFFPYLVDNQNCNILIISAIIPFIDMCIQIEDPD